MANTMSASTTNQICPWYLLDLSEDSVPGQKLQVKESFQIGRVPTSDLLLQCGSVSGTHAEIMVKDGEIWISDLDSTNGTFVNGVRIDEVTRLHKEDIVQFGSLVYQVGNDEESKAKVRTTAQTIESDIPESPEGRFHRLLRVGVVPFFQPVVDISNGSVKLAGYEVLGRGRLPGLCTPLEMFEAAKELNKEEELSQALRKHGIQVADASFSSGKMLFVNTHSSELSSKSLAAEGLAESLARIRTNHPDRTFILEVPASILGAPEKRAILDAATRGMGIQLSVYGLNATAVRLEDLQRLSPKVVKFSAEMIRDIHKADQRKQRLVATMDMMLKEFNIQRMAEFVEKRKAHETLQQLGFVFAQGYYYGHPSSIEDCIQNQMTQRAKTANGSNESPNAAKQSAGTTESVGDPAPAVGPKAETTTGAKWVLQQPANYFTVQIMATTSGQLALKYINKQRHPEKFLTYQIVSRGRRMHVVVSGSFVSRAAAEIAAEHLAAEDNLPLIRQFSHVQREFRQSIS